jgi:hypothetical protein
MITLLMRERKKEKANPFKNVGSSVSKLRVRASCADTQLAALRSCTGMGKNHMMMSSGGEGLTKLHK